MNVFELQARLSLNTSDYENALDNASGQAEQTADSISGLGDSAGGAADSFDYLSDTAGDSEKDISALETAIDKQSDALEEDASMSGLAQSSFAKLSQIMKVVKMSAAAMVAVKVGKWLAQTTDAVGQYGDNIDKMSQKIGLSSDAFQKWSFIAEHSGTSVETLKTGMRTLANATQNNTSAFLKLGISLDDLRTMSQEELFEATVRGLQKMGDSTERAVIANKLLGRGAQELAPLLNATGGDIDSMSTSLESLGGVMSEIGVKKSAAYEDALTDLKAAAQGAKNNIGLLFMEFNTSVIEKAARALGYLNTAFSDFFPKTLEEKFTRAQGRLSALQSAYDSFIEAGDEFSAEQLRGQLDAAEKEVEELTAEMETATVAIDEHENKLNELKIQYSETFGEVNKNLAGWFGAFDNAAYEVTTSADEMMANLQSQVDFWDSYSTNLETLSNAGFGNLVKAIEGMGPAGAQYAEALANMATAGEGGKEKLAELSGKLDEVEEKRGEAAETVTAIEFVDNSDESLSNIASVLNAMRDLDGTTANVFINTIQGGGESTEHAIGLDYVPFNEYPAMLHKGEAVLTAREAEEWRRGATNYKPEKIELTNNITLELDGEVVARKTYTALKNLDEAHGISLINA